MNWALIVKYFDYLPFITAVAFLCPIVIRIPKVYALIPPKIISSIYIMAVGVQAVIAVIVIMWVGFTLWIMFSYGWAITLMTVSVTAAIGWAAHHFYPPKKKDDAIDP